MKKEIIDWEAAMTETQKNSSLTAKLTERVLSSMTEVIQGQRRQARTLVDLEATIQEMMAEQERLRSSIATATKQRPVPTDTQSIFPRSWLGAAFVVGAVFGGFIMNL